MCWCFTSAPHLLIIFLPDLMLSLCSFCSYSLQGHGLEIDIEPEREVEEQNDDHPGGPARVFEETETNPKKRLRTKIAREPVVIINDDDNTEGVVETKLVHRTRGRSPFQTTQPVSFIGILSSAVHVPSLGSSARGIQMVGGAAGSFRSD